jgi:hypothetical protein
VKEIQGPYVDKHFSHSLSSLVEAKTNYGELTKKEIDDRNKWTWK